MVLEKILESPLDCKEIKSVLKEISPEYPLEGLMLKLKLQYFGHLMQGTDSLEKTLMLGRIEGERRRVRQRMRWLDGITGLMDMSLSKVWEIEKDRGAWRCLCLAALGHVRSSWTRDQTRVPRTGRWVLNHWTTGEVHASPWLLTVSSTDWPWRGPVSTP